MLLGVGASVVLIGCFLLLAPGLVRNAVCNALANSSTDNEAPATCLWDSYQQGRTATGTFATVTAEGDPVTYSIWILQRNLIRVTIQSRDRYGPRGTFDYTCSGLTWLGAANGVVHLVATGCQGPAGYLDNAGRLTVP